MLSVSAEQLDWVCVCVRVAIMLIKNLPDNSAAFPPPSVVISVAEDEAGTLAALFSGIGPSGAPPWQRSVMWKEA